MAAPTFAATVSSQRGFTAASALLRAEATFATTPSILPPVILAPAQDDNVKLVRPRAPPKRRADLSEPIQQEHASVVHVPADEHTHAWQSHDEQTLQQPDYDRQYDAAFLSSVWPEYGTMDGWQLQPELLNCVRHGTLSPQPSEVTDVQLNNTLQVTGTDNAVTAIDSSLYMAQQVNHLVAFMCSSQKPKPMSSNAAPAATLAEQTEQQATTSTDIGGVSTLSSSSTSASASTQASKRQRVWSKASSRRKAANTSQDDTSSLSALISCLKTPSSHTAVTSSMMAGQQTGPTPSSLATLMAVAQSSAHTAMTISTALSTGIIIDSTTSSSQQSSTVVGTAGVDGIGNSTASQSSSNVRDLQVVLPSDSIDADEVLTQQQSTISTRQRRTLSTKIANMLESADNIASQLQQITSSKAATNAANGTSTQQQQASLRQQLNAVLAALLKQHIMWLQAMQHSNPVPQEWPPSAISSNAESSSSASIAVGYEICWQTLTRTVVKYNSYMSAETAAYSLLVLSKAYEGRARHVRDLQHSGSAHLNRDTAGQPNNAQAEQPTKLIPGNIDAYQLLTQCTSRLLRITLSQLEHSAPSTIVITLRALYSLPNRSRTRGGVGRSRIRLRKEVFQKAVPMLMEHACKTLGSLDERSIVYILFAIAKTGTGCKLLPAGFISKALAQLQPSLHAATHTQSLHSTAYQQQQQHNQASSRPERAVTPLSAQQLAQLAWSLAVMGQTPPDSWKQAYSSAVIHNASLLKPSELSMVCSTLAAWSLSQTHTYSPTESQTQLNSQSSQQKFQSAPSAPATAKQPNDPQARGNNRIALTDNNDHMCDTGSDSSHSQWPSSQLLHAVGTTLIAGLPGCRPSEVAGMFLQLSQAGWHPSAGQLRPLLAHVTLQLKPSPQHHHQQQQHSVAPTGCWSARQLSVLLAALADCAVKRNLSVALSKQWLTQSILAIQADVKKSCQEDVSTTPRARLQQQQAGLALCRCIAALPILITPPAQASDQTPHSEAHGPLLVKNTALRTSAIQLLQSFSPELILSLSQPRPLLRLLEGASVLLGPAACTALTHEAQQCIQQRLAEQDGSISGDGWFRLRAAYQRMNTMPGPELAMKLEAHS